MSNVSLPANCATTDFNGPNVPGKISASFSGCVVGVAAVLETCCTTAGSAAAFVNNTCGCPFPSNNGTDEATREANVAAFQKCAGDNKAEVSCGPTSNNAARVAGSVRWNFAIMVLGTSVIMGAMGL
ncbi:hypothetical protein B0H19DRAFT_1382736 [Mycena capillaripes]|nr:hypothetical protein B0H19DRAFT_1382736 [Mycena capillaripes]